MTALNTRRVTTMVTEGATEDSCDSCTTSLGLTSKIKTKETLNTYRASIWHKTSGREDIFQEDLIWSNCLARLGSYGRSRISTFTL